MYDAVIKIVKELYNRDKAIVPLPISVGDVIIENVFGASVVATKNVGE